MNSLRKDWERYDYRLLSRSRIPEYRRGFPVFYITRLSSRLAMSCYPCVHHVEIGVVDGPATVECLKLHYGFKVIAFRQSAVADQWLLVRNDTRFLVTSLKTGDQELLKDDNYVINWTATKTSSELPSKDSVFNIAFQVKNIDAFIQRLENQGVDLSKSLRVLSDSEGTVRTCVVKSIVGDVHHTLIEKSDYAGVFLPCFEPVGQGNLQSDQHAEQSLIYFDHAAMSAEMNTTTAIIAWYERCFGMKKFIINRDEDKENGLVLSTDKVGLRLRAMEYWKCAEVGLLAADTDDGHERLPIVIGEALSSEPENFADNQIESWIRQHGGPGIQHIAIYTPDIKSTVRSLKLSGATFAKPPPDTYYSEIGRLHDIIKAGEDIEGLKENGILIDTEADGIFEVERKQSKENKESYLLQIFTKPLLPSDPFFLELIQREGATGFGSGNVEALYRSVQAYIVDGSSP
ncbi:4-hydroxyphenylpyruvate dioxygenase-like protein isoform X1 [Biomphalaria glabrata]